MKLVVNKKHLDYACYLRQTELHYLSNYIIVKFTHIDGGPTLELIAADNDLEYWTYAPNNHSRAMMDILFSWNIPFEVIKA